VAPIAARAQGAPATQDTRPAAPPREPGRAAELKENATTDTENGETKRTGHGPEEEPKDVEAARAVFIGGDVGFTRGQLGIAPHDLGFDKTGANGENYGIFAGYRTSSLRLGARWRVQDTTEFDLWSFAATAGYAFSSRPWTPIVTLHLGYVFDEKLQAGLFRSSIPPGNVVLPDVELKGPFAGLDLAGEYWVSKEVRLGGFVGVDAMYLFRPRAETPQSLFGPTPDFDRLALYSTSGSTLALMFNLGIRGEFDLALR
jgi:hypothetical protein